MIRGNAGAMATATRTRQGARDGASVVGLRRFATRIALMGAAIGLAGIPFTLLGVIVHTEGTAANSVDLAVASRLHAGVSASPVVTDALRLISTVFHPNAFRFVLVVLAFVLFKRARRLSIWILVTVAGESLLDVALKVAFGRARPTFSDPLVTASGGSFPSGHAFGSFVGCAVIVLVLLPLLRGHHRRLAITVAVLIVALVGLARVGLGAHYVSDVIGGWLLGAAWVALTTAAFQSWREDVGLRRAHPTEEGLSPELPRDLATDSSG